MVIDDDPEITGLFKLLVSDTYEVTGFTSGDAAIDAATSDTFPVVILDLGLGETSGVAVMRRLKEICSYQQIIILTGRARLETAVDSLNLGAFRFLRKPFCNQVMRSMVSSAFDQFSKEKSFVESQAYQSADLRSLGLSPREAEVAQLVTQGCTNVEIRQILGISVRTVEKHVEKIFRRFGISCRGKLQTAVHARLGIGGFSATSHIKRGTADR